MENLKIDNNDLGFESFIDSFNPEQYDDFGVSTGYTDQWEAWATYHGHAIPEVDIRVKGNTPREALNNLAKELNK